MSAKGETKTSTKKQETTRNDEKSTSTPEFRTEMEYFQRERSRLDTSMKRQLSKHVKPEKKEYFPYVFNSLEPYADMNVYSKALDAPFKTPQYQYRSRNTAHGLKDPTISHSMDTNLNYFDDKGKRNRERRKVLQEMQQKLQQDDARSNTASTDRRDQSTSDITGKDEREPASGKPAGQQQKRPQSNSTATGGETRRTTTRRSRSNEKTSEKSDETERFPLFPTVIAVPNELSGKDLNYSHVPRLREELHNTYSMNASRKIDQQYRLTKHEFHQRQLDRVDEYHPDSWPTMREAYFAYLQNNPGSARAVRECVKRLNDDVEQEQQQQQQQQQQSARNERQEPAESNTKEQEEKEDDGGAASQKRMEIIQGAQYKLNLIGGHYD